MQEHSLSGQTGNTRVGYIRHKEKHKIIKKVFGGAQKVLKHLKIIKKFLIKPFQAREYVNDRVVVRGKINTMKKNNSKVMVLSLENDLRYCIF